MAEQYDGFKELGKATAETGAMGSLIALAGNLPPAMVPLFAVGGVATTVSLTGVAAPSASVAIAAQFAADGIAHITNKT